MDSLGQIIKKKMGSAGRTEALSFKIRDNCYVLFCTGIMLDHMFSCFCFDDIVAATLTMEPDQRSCISLQNFPDGPWPFDIRTIIAMPGDTKCQLGMLLLGGYFHAQKGPKFGLLDVALLGIYLLWNNLYWLPTYLMQELSDDHNVGELAMPSKVFEAPKWFLLCFIYARLVICGCNLLNKRIDPEGAGPFTPLLQILAYFIFGVTYKAPILNALNFQS